LTEEKINETKNAVILIPLFGALLFIIFYIIAITLYPGGSQADISSKGFSWMNNYWCNLLNEKAMNGEYNTARPFAIAGMLLLCISMAAFLAPVCRIGIN